MFENAKFQSIRHVTIYCFTCFNRDSLCLSLPLQLYLNSATYCSDQFQVERFIKNMGKWVVAKNQDVTWAAELPRVKLLV